MPHVSSISRHIASMTNLPLIPSHYFLQLCELLKLRGINPEDWLKYHGLSLRDIQGKVQFLECKHYIKLIKTAIEYPGQADLGLRLGQSLAINSHGTLGFALLNCASLGQALALFQRFVALRTPLLAIQSESLDKSERFTFVELFDISPIRQAFLEASVMALQSTLRILYPQQNVVQNIEFDWSQPEYWHHYASYFDCEVRFGRPAVVMDIAHALLSQPLPGRDPQSLLQAERYCQTELESFVHEDDVAGQVYQWLMLSPAHARTLELVAKKMHLSPRTLHRHLLAQQQSFKSLLDKVNQTLACQLFAKGWTVAAVAQHLGYADVANFRRAFKRWLGMAPQQYLQQWLP
jgi:AraC-like DNA-binding protein